MIRGTGESSRRLERLRVGFLRREQVIGLNKIYPGLTRFGFYPRCYVTIKPKVLQQSAQETRILNCVKLARSEASDRFARQVFEAEGRRIVDATLDGACTVFPRLAWDALFPTSS
jgi:hypothetical protein